MLILLERGANVVTLFAAGSETMENVSSCLCSVIVPFESHGKKKRTQKMWIAHNITQGHGTRVARSHSVLRNWNYLTIRIYFLHHVKVLGAGIIAFSCKSHALHSDNTECAASSLSLSHTLSLSLTKPKA